MSLHRKPAKEASAAPRARKAHSRQRQRLIEACISALHMYGPSRTTVEKVVAIAKMSPGIVRFYFDSKAAMLVASLQFLAAEFEERLLVPVAKLKATPVAALELLVDLYLDPDIASPRKVSVWYAFWGEASSRQEYYDICGQKDESFATMVRDLIERLIIETAQPQLDPDGISLGLIGALEMLWQDFAFQTERNIDRPAAKARCMAYLRSIFPGRFAVPDGRLRPPASAPAGDGRFIESAYADARIHAMERELLFRDAWAVVGHESQVARAGEFFCIDSGAERILVVRDASGSAHALRNSCPAAPHTLIAGPSGRLDGQIECRLHGLRFALDGRCAAGTGRMDLTVLELSSVDGLLFARPAHGERAVEPWPGAGFDTPLPDGLALQRPPSESLVEADWKVVVEQWLDSPMQPMGDPSEAMVWDVPVLRRSSWSALRYLKLMECAPDRPWRRQFIAPNQLLERRPDGLAVIQSVPAAPGRCLVRRMDYSVLPPGAYAAAVRHLACRLSPYAGRTIIDAAESVQRGMIEFGYGTAPGARPSPALAWFRNRLAARVPALVRHPPPTAR